MLGAKPVSVLDVLLGALLAAAAYGGVAAVAFALTMPPFAELFGAPRWTVFAFFTLAGMALTSTLLQMPPFLLLVLLLRRRGAAAPLVILAVGGVVGAAAAVVFTFLDGSLVADRMGDLKSVIRTTVPPGLVLAGFVILAAWLRRRSGRREGAGLR